MQQYSITTLYVWCPHVNFIDHQLKKVQWGKIFFNLHSIFLFVCNRGDTIQSRQSPIKEVRPNPYAIGVPRVFLTPSRHVGRGEAGRAYAPQIFGPTYNSPPQIFRPCNMPAQAGVIISFASTDSLTLLAIGQRQYNLSVHYQPYYNTTHTQ